MQTENINKFKGIFPPLITPLKDNNTLDREGFERLIEHTLSGGVHGVFVLGTSGEFASLSHHLRKEIVAEACKIVAGRVPVLVGISDTSISETISIAQTAADNGADALVVTAPYYFAIHQLELQRYIEYLLTQITLPVFLYNIPANTKVMFDVETIKTLSANQAIIGMKDSSSDLAYMRQVQFSLKERNDFIFMTGTEEFLAEFIIGGGHGGVNGGANMFPALYVELYEASIKKDFNRIYELQNIVMHVISAIYQVGNSCAGYLRGIKAVLSVMGICNDFMAYPLLQLNKTERNKIKLLLEDEIFSDFYKKLA